MISAEARVPALPGRTSSEESVGRWKPQRTPAIHQEEVLDAPVGAHGAER